MENLTNIAIYDRDYINDSFSCLQLTENQIKLIKWLQDNEFLGENIEIKVIDEFETV